MKSPEKDPPLAREEGWSAFFKNINEIRSLPSSSPLGKANSHLKKPRKKNQYAHWKAVLEFSTSFIWTFTARCTPAAGQPAKKICIKASGWAIALGSLGGEFDLFWAVAPQKLPDKVHLQIHLTSAHLGKAWIMIYSRNGKFLGSMHGEIQGRTYGSVVSGDGSLTRMPMQD